jgi:sulfur-carrier protein adenylyltransferase/sulfurtransferase
VGGRSRAAVQFLAGKGFKEVYNMKGGINEWNGIEANGPIETGMTELKGDESIEEIIILAYGMENGLSIFYKKMIEIIDDREITDLLVTLSSFEDIHKQKLFSLYKTLNNSDSDEETFKSSVVSDVMESGFTVAEFIEKSRPAMDTAAGVLNIAMMLETQALDLYLRYSQETMDKNIKIVLQNIADEEKAHLEALGKLMDKIQS